ncbi:MAG: Amuc_1100 family pilus-like protein [Verrucomicrobiota bacterium]
MKVRKNMVLIVGGGVAAVLLIIALLMLLRFQRAYQRVNRDLKSAMSSLDRLYRLDPYPSEENVLLVQTNLAVLQGYFAELYASLRKSQIEPSKMEPAEFPLLLDKTIGKLRLRARAPNALLPARFAFGFDRYAVGALPNQEDVPRLVIQLKTIEELCGLLYDSGVSEIASFQRPLFEQGAAEESFVGGPMGRGARRQMLDMASEETAQRPVQSEWRDPSGLFVRERYTLTFKAKDPAIWAVLNALDRSKLFTVVSRVELANESPLPKPAVAAKPAAPAAGPGGRTEQPGMVFPGVARGIMGGAAGGAQPQAAPADKALSHEERIVAGRELIKAIVDVDVYRFVTPEEEEKAK